MTDLSLLRVSLTKHGAHKIAQLLAKVEPDEVLGSVWHKFEGINIDRAQVRSILSADDQGRTPEFWAEARRRGAAAVRATTFLAIVFSHYRLIEAFKEGGTGFASGTIRRTVFADIKEFTNLKDDIRSLGFSTFDDVNEVRYDLRPLFSDPDIPDIATQLLDNKLLRAGWSRDTALVDECISQEFHLVLSVPENQLREWLALGIRSDPAEITLEELEQAVSDDALYESFSFQSGHKPRKASGSRGQSPILDASINLAHNKLQTKLYEHLCTKFGAANIGTEQYRVDIVRRDGDELTFYEIKVGQDIRSCIREALAQLLEYAYWPNSSRATRLVVVAPCAPSDAARKYMKMLRERFGIPIYYQQADANTGVLGEEI